MISGQVCLRRGETLAAGCCWIYDNEIDWADDTCEDGGLVEVLDSRMRYQGTGFFNRRSKITVRLVSRERGETIDRAFWERRIRAAWENRQALGFSNACRVIFGEPDGLPGLTGDKFGDCLSFQIVSLMAVDIENGQKTGHFLDQQENRGHLRPYSAGRTVLDLCCHTGGFSIHAALYGAAHVQAVDVSETALAMVRGNAARNGVADRVETVCANVFDLVRQDCEEGRQFGLVICDPPAFAKSRSALDGAYRGYRELNRRCVQLTEPGGFLVTCSCSQFMTQPLFEQMLTEAAKGAGRQVRLLERLMQSRDHPATLGEEHSMYLKGCILQVL